MGIPKHLFVMESCAPLCPRKVLSKHPQTCRHCLLQQGTVKLVPAVEERAVPTSSTAEHSTVQTDPQSLRSPNATVKKAKALCTLKAPKDLTTSFTCF